MNPVEVDEVSEWPNLAEAHGFGAARSMEEEWEMIAPDEDFEQEMVVVHTNPKIIRRCASSPDFRYINGVLEAVLEEDDSSQNACRDDASSHVLVSVPESLVSTTSASVKRVPSFRDVILLQIKELANEQVQLEAEATPTKTRSQKVKPKIVVTPIRRCSRSTGDLQSLIIHEDVLGESDAMEYYHRKAMGHSGRVNGLKERPDEAKRKNITLYKKQLQRQEQDAKRG